jgi:lichenan operon transcriptional antiterminator
VPDTFLNSVLERERVSATSFPKGFAIPHPIEACSYRTIVSVGILKKPILWGDYRVKCIFFLAIRDEDKKYLGRFFNTIVEMTENRAKVQNIANTKDFSKFLDLITKTEL